MKTRLFIHKELGNYGYMNRVRIRRKTYYCCSFSREEQGAEVRVSTFEESEERALAIMAGNGYIMKDPSK